MVPGKRETAMGLFSKLFGKDKKKSGRDAETAREAEGAQKARNAPAEPAVEPKEPPAEFTEAMGLLSRLGELDAEDRYIARSDYKDLIGRYAALYASYASLKDMGTLSFYCEKNGVEEGKIEGFLKAYEDIRDLKKGSPFFARHNGAFVKRHMESEREYLDGILREVDPAISLDAEQRAAVLSDEDHTLIVAGAGTGKTTTVAAKVRYLVERRGIDAEKILVISFTNKAVGELKERINGSLGIPCPITTFHSTGYAILRKQEETPKKVASDGFLFRTVNEYLKGSILRDPALAEKLILFFGSYFTAPYEGEELAGFFSFLAKTSYRPSLRADLEGYSAKVTEERGRKHVTVSDETVRSGEEVLIANFLYLNGLDYAYEEPYPYRILYARKPYTPDFTIRQGDRTVYLEHFGVTEDGQNTRYTPEELERYRRAIRDKTALHRKHGTKLVCTYSSYRDGRSLQEHLEENLRAAGLTLKKRSAEEVFRKLADQEEDGYIYRLTDLVCAFIRNFKTNGWALDDFYRLESQGVNVRTKLFLEICRACYLEYQRRLTEERAVDFQDMINESARLIRERRLTGGGLDFCYIIVDEYQDISRQRFNLTKELSGLCGAKIVAVGDDWQSVYAFSGSQLPLFTKFEESVGYADTLRITRTYRNAQEVIDIAGSFVQKNDAQIKKTLVSPKHIAKPVIIRAYSEEYDRKQFRGKGGIYYHLGRELEAMIGQILERNAAEGLGENSTILLIGRYHFDARNLCYSEDFAYNEENGKIFSKKYPRARLEFLTAHSSKGLSYDNVVIVNTRDEKYGFPAQIEDDPVMKLVVCEDLSMEYAEERRLFYVAMTRTRNRVYILTPEGRPSEFVTELVRDYPDVTLSGELRERKKDGKPKNACPVCGYPLVQRYNTRYGLRLWLCTNEPEICDFITNDLSGGTMSIRKCDRCRDGYLIVKKTKDEGAILGCTKYRKDGTGCNRMINREYYARWLTEGFGEDLSATLPAYESGKAESVPAPKANAAARGANKTPDSAAAGNAQRGTDAGKAQRVPGAGKAGAGPAEGQKKQGGGVHLTTKQLQYVEKDGFMVVADDEGNILTDMDLLKRLRGLRNRIAQKEGKPPYTVFKNDALVSLATFRPGTREEFVALRGLSERSYDAYGRLFLAEIRKYYGEK